MECPGKTLSSSPALPCILAWRLVQMDSHWNVSGHCCLWYEKCMSENDWGTLLLGVAFALVSGSGCTVRDALNPCSARLCQCVHCMPQQMGFCWYDSHQFMRKAREPNLSEWPSLPSQCGYSRKVSKWGFLCALTICLLLLDCTMFILEPLLSLLWICEPLL